jgi:hypothetical protein
VFSLGLGGARRGARLACCATTQNLNSYGHISQYVVVSTLKFCGVMMSVLVSVCFILLLRLVLVSRVVV